MESLAAITLSTVISAAIASAAIAYCLANPRWRLSLQTHKLLAIP